MGEEQIGSVQANGGETAYADESPFQLDDVFTAFKKGTARGFEIRYHHNGFDWTDLVFGAAKANQVVRCQHPNQEK